MLALVVAFKFIQNFHKVNPYTSPLSELSTVLTEALVFSDDTSSATETFFLSNFASSTLLSLANV